MLVDGPKRALARRQGHVADGAEHDKTQGHRQRLEPQQGIAGEDTQIQTAGQ